MGIMNNQLPNDLIQLVNTINNYNNPQMIASQMMRENPRLGQELNMLLQNGKSPQQAAFELMRQRGLNPQQLVSMLRK